MRSTLGLLESFMRRAGMAKLALVAVVAVFLGGCDTERIPPGEGRSRQQCCSGELWQYQ
jgi:hypothetical protein